MKNIKKHHFLSMLAASALILAMMTSCGASSSDYAKASEDYNVNFAEKGMSMSRANDELYGETEAYEEDSVAETGQKSGEKVTAEYEDKIIRTADITMESGDAQKCYDTLLAFVKKNGGKEISISKSSETYGSYDYIYYNAELKIAPDKLDAFLALAEKTDKVTSSEVSSNDVTQDYYDIKLRLNTKKEALKSYYKLLKEATTIEEALEVQRYITDLTAEIESMEGMLKYYDSKIDLSTVNLSIRQQVKVHAGAKDDFQWDSLSFSDFITLIKNGFLSVINFLWSLLLWMIIIVIAVSPLLLIVGLVVFLVRRYRKKHPRKPKVRKQKQPAMAQNYMPVYYPQQNVPSAPVDLADTTSGQNNDDK